MNDSARLFGGSFLLLTGTVLLYYCALSDVLHVPPVRWFQRPLLLAPASIAFFLAGGWLLAE